MQLVHRFAGRDRRNDRGQAASGRPAPTSLVGSKYRVTGFLGEGASKKVYLARDRDLDLFPEQIGWADGYAFASDRPGLGVEIDEAVAEARAATSGGWPPLLRRNDDAFTNW